MVPIFSSSAPVSNPFFFGSRCSATVLFTKPPAEARGVRRGRHPSQGTQAAGRGIDLWSHGAGSRRDAQAPPKDAARRASETRVALLAGRPGEAPPFPGAAADRGERGPAPRRPHGRVHPAPRDPAGTDPPGDSRAGKSGRGGAPGTAPRQSGAPTRSPGDRAQSRSGGAPARCPGPSNPRAGDRGRASGHAGHPRPRPLARA